MDKRINLPNVISFDWDKGNQEKNTLKHNVENSECEEVFFNNPVFLPDTVHSQIEDRYYAFGVTNNGRFLLIAFTIRKNKVRVISARTQDKKEKEYYHKQRKEVK
jgi:uncharacterized DUF497 family protein